MTLLLTSLWPALAASLLLGAGIGAVAGFPRPALAKAAAAALGLAAIILAALILAGVALAGLAPGRPGFWIEGAACALGAYLAGCVLGAVIDAALRRSA